MKLNILFFIRYFSIKLVYCIIYQIIKGSTVFFLCGILFLLTILIFYQHWDNFSGVSSTIKLMHLKRILCSLINLTVFVCFLNFGMAAFLKSFKNCESRACKRNNITRTLLLTVTSQWVTIVTHSHSALPATGNSYKN